MNLMVESTTDVPVDSPWGIEDLDLPRYLTRLGLDPHVPDVDPDTAQGLDLLRTLHRRHIAAMPFENVDPVLGRAPGIDMESLQAKLVDRRRGGHCVELNLMFAAAVERLGFEVRRLGARVVTGRPTARTHTAMTVRAGGTVWLADTGFRTGLLEPIELRDGATVSQGGRTLGLRREPDRTWTLHAVHPEPADLYRFADEELNWPDNDLIHLWAVHHPNSPVSGSLVVATRDDDSHRLLRGRRLVEDRPGAGRTTRTITEEKMPELLRDAFGLDLDDAELAGLRAAHVATTRTGGQEADR